MTTAIANPSAPGSIRASIHQDALTRVPDFFNATNRQILNELFQNCRRAGATRVDVSVSERAVTISDDGRGIENPQTLLSFGQTGWNGDTTRSEHPAGMGLYSLARRSKTVIISRIQGNPAWQVTLEPAHFVGEADAPIQPAPDFDRQHGTAVTYSNTLDQGTAKRDVQDAAEYYPLPVTLNGMSVEQRDFLEDAVRIETWRGVRIGVYTSLNHNPMNFHGTVIRNPRLPRIPLLDRSWSVKADVIDCPELQLTLPTRHEVVETPFMEELRTACRAAVYQAILVHPDPVDVPYEIQQEAARMGITLPEARPRLTPWTPGTARGGNHWTQQRERQPLPATPIVIHNNLSAADQQALGRAADLTGNTHRLFKSQPNFHGYAWYDRLPHIQSVRTTIQAGDVTYDLDQARKGEQEPPAGRPDRISITVQAKGGDRNRLTLGMPTDLAFWHEYDEGADEALPLVAKDSGVTPKQLTKFMMDAYFSPSDDKDADSAETQEEDYQDVCLQLAIQLLVSPEEALRSALENAAARHLQYLLYPDASATIRLTQGCRPEATISKKAEEPAG